MHEDQKWHENKEADEEPYGVPISDSDLADECESVNKSEDNYSTIQTRNKVAVMRQQVQVLMNQGMVPG